MSEEARLNMSKGAMGKVFSDEHKAKIGDSSRGRVMTEEQKEKLREKIECPHCKLIGGKSNMKRFHFDNCKNFKEEILNDF